MGRVFTTTQSNKPSQECFRMAFTWSEAEKLTVSPGCHIRFTT